MTSQDVHVALQKRFEGWPYIKEFRAGTGLGAGSERYLDAFTMQPFPSLPMTSIAIEIKVTRGDFTKEKRRPMKRDAALRISNQFYFAAPKGLLVEDEIPIEAGLIEVSEEGVAEITTDAPYRDALPTWPFVASLARKIYELQAQLQGQTPMKAMEKIGLYETALRKWKLAKSSGGLAQTSDPEPTPEEYHITDNSLKFMAKGIMEKVLGR
jgi:hypothetical protein